MYFEKYYIGELVYDFDNESTYRTVPTYPPERWNFFSGLITDADIPRTNNMVEGFHRGFRYRFLRGSATVFEYVAGIKEQQVLTDYHLDRLEKSIMPAKRGRPNNKDDKLKSIVKVA